MPGIANPDVIDVVGLTPNEDAVLVYVIEESDWGSQVNADLLNAKMQAYVAFILDGQFEREYAEVSGKPVEFVFRFMNSSPSKGVVQELESLRGGLAGYGIGLRVLGPADPPL